MVSLKIMQKDTWTLAFRAIMGLTDQVRSYLVQFFFFTKAWNCFDMPQSSLIDLHLDYVRVISCFIQPKWPLSSLILPQHQDAFRPLDWLKRNQRLPYLEHGLDLIPSNLHEHLSSFKHGYNIGKHCIKKLNSVCSPCRWATCWRTFAKRGWRWRVRGRRATRSGRGPPRRSPPSSGPGGTPPSPSRQRHPPTVLIAPWVP